MTLLTVETEKGADATRIALRGELDIATADRLDEQLELVHRERPALLVLDLRRLEFMDSTGLRLVVRADSEARDRGGRLLIVRGPEPVNRVFELVGLAERFEFADEPPPLDGA